MLTVFLTRSRKIILSVFEIGKGPKGPMAMNVKLFKEETRLGYFYQYSFYILTNTFSVRLLVIFLF